MKVDVEDVEQLIRKNIEKSEEVEAVLKDIEQLVEELKLERQKNKRKKKKLMAIQLDDVERVYIIEGSDDFKEETLIDVIKHKIVVDFNQSKKGSKNPVSKMADAFEFVTRNFYKNYELAVKTKQPLDIIKSSNKIDFVKESMKDVET